MAEAFTAGVKPGGLTDDTQIRILLCYLIKTAGPLTRDTLQGALLQEQLVNYFEFADALAEVQKQGLVTCTDEQYSITDKGASVASTLAHDLPRTVRESAIRAVMQIQSWRHKAASNRAHVEEKDGKYVVWCNIGDLGSDVFQLQLTMPDKLTAEMTKNMFIAHGSDIYSKLMDMLTQPGTDDDRRCCDMAGRCRHRPCRAVAALQGCGIISSIQKRPVRRDRSFCFAYSQPR